MDWKFKDISELFIKHSDVDQEEGSIRDSDWHENLCDKVTVRQENSQIERVYSSKWEEG